MPTLRVLEVWPSTGYPERPLHPHPDVAAFLAANRGVCELYSRDLPAAGIEAKYSHVRFFAAAGDSAENWRVALPDRWYEGFDSGAISVPHGFARLPEPDRVQAALEVLHAGLVGLGERRGWSTEPLEGVRQRAVRDGLRLRWQGPWKQSPDRRHRARGIFRLAPDGHGRAQLEVRSIADDVLVARTAEAFAVPTLPGFSRSAASVRWHGASSLGFVPWTWMGIERGHVELDLGGNTSVEPEVVDLPVQPADALVVQVETAVPEPGPWIGVIGISTIERPAYGTEVHRVVKELAHDEEHRRWWSAIPFAHLEIEVGVIPADWPSVPFVRARKAGDVLRMGLTRRSDELPPHSDVAALRARARADVLAALAELARSRRFSAPPSGTGDVSA